MKRSALLLIVFSATLARAHGFAPSLLEVRERSATVYSARFRTAPRNEERESRLVPRFEGCTEPAERVTEHDAAGDLVHVALSCPEGLAGTVLRLTGLRPEDTEVLVRILWRDRPTLIRVLRGDHPVLEIPAHATAFTTLRDYVRLGVGHILSGYDHLLFVLGLVLLVRSRRSLATAVTAFTVAHSLTLSAAVLGWVHCPQRPAEAVIALSILLLAVELARRAEAQATWSARFPAAVAFLFGLVHGFGFSGALTDIGLPPGAVPLALFGFNVGVELGQVFCVACVLGLGTLLRAFAPQLLRFGRAPVAYVMGPIAMFWCCERLGALWS